MKYILSIETSCDETSVSVINTSGVVLSLVVYSQIDLHKKFGGVVPELAARDHASKILLVFNSALEKANLKLENINYIAVTSGPGLLGCLLVGLSFAKAISYALKIPLIPVDHIKAHLFSYFIGHKKIKFPFIGLVVSGGHTNIYKVESLYDISLIASTVDDAAGECFDKIARYIGLAYPGGKALSQKAENGNINFLKFKKPRVKNKKYAFSFSGIKTSVINYINTNNNFLLEDLLASFEHSVANILVDTVIDVAIDYNIKDIIISGGVAANKRLRDTLNNKSKKNNLSSYLVPLQYCGDNAAMIANYARFYLKNYKYSNSIIDEKAYATSRL